MRFNVKAVSKEGVIRTVLEATDAAQASRLAENQGLRILSMHPERSLFALPKLPKIGLGPQVSFPLVLFSQELATLLNAGLALIDALESLAEQEADPGTRKTLSNLVRLLYEGKSLSQALGEMPEVFPDLYVALIQSSEKTSGLGDALGRYVAYRTRIDLVRQKVVSSSVYPLLLFFVGSGVLLFLIGYVVPRFSVIFEDMGSNLPWLSRVLLDVGKAIHANQTLLLIGAVVAAVTAVALSRQPSVRRWMWEFANSIPAIRHRLFTYQIARLYRSLGILLRGGIPVLTAMGMVKGLVDSATRTRLYRASESVRQGRALSHALSATGLATPVALRMLLAGEQSGDLGGMMEKTADFYDEEMSRWIDWFIRLFEPVLMVFVGGMIGVIVVLMYIPIFELASSIQ